MNRKDYEMRPPGKNGKASLRPPESWKPKLEEAPGSRFGWWVGCLQKWLRASERGWQRNKRPWARACSLEAEGGWPGPWMCLRPFHHVGGLSWTCRQTPRHLGRSFLLNIDKAPAFLGKVVCTPKHLSLGWVSHMCQGLTPIFLHMQEFEVHLCLWDISCFNLESITCRASEGAVCSLWGYLLFTWLVHWREGCVATDRSHVTGDPHLSNYRVPPASLHSQGCDCKWQTQG